jgi:hypothetical protein
MVQTLLDRRRPRRRAKLGSCLSFVSNEVLSPCVNAAGDSLRSSTSVIRPCRNSNQLQSTKLGAVSHCSIYMLSIVFICSTLALSSAATFVNGPQYDNHQSTFARAPSSNLHTAPHAAARSVWTLPLETNARPARALFRRKSTFACNLAKDGSNSPIFYDDFGDFESEEDDDDDDDDETDSRLNQLGDWRTFRRTLAAAARNEHEWNENASSTEPPNTAETPTATSTTTSSSSSNSPQSKSFTVSSAAAWSSLSTLKNDQLLESQNAALAEEYRLDKWAHATATVITIEQAANGANGCSCASCFAVVLDYTCI